MGTVSLGIGDWEMVIAHAGKAPGKNLNRSKLRKQRRKNFVENTKMTDWDRRNPLMGRRIRSKVCEVRGGMAGSPQSQRHEADEQDQTIDRNLRQADAGAMRKATRPGPQKCNKRGLASP